MSGDFSKKYDYESQSREEIKIFLNLVVRDKIEICFFYISCFKTNLVFQHLEFDLSHLEKGTRNKKLIFEVEQEFSREFWDQDRIRSHWRQNNFSERIMFKPSIIFTMWKWKKKYQILKSKSGKRLKQKAISLFIGECLASKSGLGIFFQTLNWQCLNTTKLFFGMASLPSLCSNLYINGL